MKYVSATAARANLYGLIDDIHANHQPALITGKRGNAVTIAEDDWRAIEETLYLNAIPGMADSIIAGMNETPEDKDTPLEWE